MGRHARTQHLIDAAREILETHIHAGQSSMILRQVFYRLVARQVVENSRGRYQALSDALVDARKEGQIPWEWMQDRLRKPRTVSMWANPAEFAADVCPQYRLDVWDTQPAYLEVWLEKDALSGIFEDVLDPYGVTLNVGRGYDGWASIHSAAERYRDRPRVTILYFGDFDPSGEDMVRSLRERLAFFGCTPDIVKVALTAEDVEHYHLPPDFTKVKDSRRAAFVEKFGDVAVELDALPPDALSARIVAEVEARMDLAALERARRLEGRQREMIARRLRAR